jgi:hypothetical protein
MAGEEPIVNPDAPAPAVEAPVAAPAVEPVAAAPEAPKHPHEIPTLLETFKAPGAEPAKAAEKAAESPAVETKPADAKPAEVKPETKVEAKPDAEKPATEEKAAEAEPEAPVEYKFDFPDHVKPQDEKVAAFTEFAREHKLTPEAAQKAVGYFNEAATAFVQEQAAKQVQVWNDTRAGWRKEILASPFVGGSGHDAAMGVAVRARDLATSILAGGAVPGSPKYNAQAERVENFVRITGAGDHTVFVEILHALGGVLDEPRQPNVPPQPTKNNGKRPSNSLYASK